MTKFPRFPSIYFKTDKRTLNGLICSKSCDTDTETFDPELTKRLILFVCLSVFFLDQDTDGLKVGVASLITQWVKGPCDGSRQSAGRPAVSVGRRPDAFHLLIKLRAETRGLWS